ncbi:MAG: amidinotransferase [Rhodothermales bacterium]|nr:amidinotransferase [Rhodothermales bacterium]
MVYTRLDDVLFRLDDLPAMPKARRILMTTPEHFSVEYVINPHMAGHVGQTNRSAARSQWQTLKDAYERLGLDVATVAGADGQPDMVFCANQTLPFVLPDGQKGVVLSNMHANERKGEVPHYARFFEGLGYAAHPLDAALGDFEGMGDALWHAGRRLLWGGYGFRTSLDAYERISALADAPVLALELRDPDFYHLDTCLSVLDDETALYYPGAFTADGVALLRAFWPRLVEAPADDARERFACNAHCPNGRHVLIHPGSRVTNARLREAGYEVVEIETGEYLKSGGSVFCMKVVYW